MGAPAPGRAQSGKPSVAQPEAAPTISVLFRKVSEVGVRPTELGNRLTWTVFAEPYPVLDERWRLITLGEAIVVHGDTELSDSCKEAVPAR